MRFCLTSIELQATVKLSKNVAPGLTLSVSDEFPNPHKKGKVRS